MAFIFNLTVNYIIIWLNECNAIESWLYIIYIYIRFYFSVAFSSRFCFVACKIYVYTIQCFVIRAPYELWIYRIKAQWIEGREMSATNKGNGGDGDSGWISNSNDHEEAMYFTQLICLSPPIPLDGVTKTMILDIISFPYYILSILPWQLYCCQIIQNE